MLHDLRRALRSLLRAPGLFAAAVVTMGTGRRIVAIDPAHTLGED